MMQANMQHGEKSRRRIRFAALQQDVIACVGEFVGTTMFLFLGLGGAKAALSSIPSGLVGAQTGLDSQTVVSISLSMGLSLLVTAWIFYRITGGLFNPAVTLALYLVGAIRPFRAMLLFLSQLLGGLASCGLLTLLTPRRAPNPGVASIALSLSPDLSHAQGLFIEALLTSALIFCILMLAAEKHKSTYLAPIGIGLTLFACQLMGTLWTGCGMNPARALGPSVISGKWGSEHWIYWVGPFLGSCFAAMFYLLLKAFDYTTVVTSQDSCDAAFSPVSRLNWHAATLGFSRSQREALLASGTMTGEMIDQAEKSMVDAAVAGVAEAVAMTRNGTKEGVGMEKVGTQQGAMDMSRSATATTQPPPRPTMSRYQTSLTVPTLHLTDKADGLISTTAMAQHSISMSRTPSHILPAISLEDGLIKQDFAVGNASQLSLAMTHRTAVESQGGVQATMVPAQQDVGAIGEPGLEMEGCGVKVVEKLGEILRA